MIKQNLLLFFLIIQFNSYAIETFRFAFLTDLHIDTSNNLPSEDLQKAVNEINKAKDIDFVLIGGDVTENGDSASLVLAKSLLNKLKIPYYITFGNHDVRSDKAGIHTYLSVFETDRFLFYHKGIKFIGITSAPVVAKGIGHIAAQDINWLNTELSKTDKQTSIIFITHYPLLTGDVDNWFELTDVLLKYNIQAILNGHYHRNVVLNFDGIAGIVNRSVLRGTEAKGGYSIYSVSNGLSVSEKIIDTPEREWFRFSIEKEK